MEKDSVKDCPDSMSFKDQTEYAVDYPKLPSVADMPVKLRRKFDRAWDSSSGMVQVEKKNPPAGVLSTDNILAIYLQEISKTPLLTKEGEVRLSQLIENGLISETDSDSYWLGVWAKEKLVVSNLRLVVSIAKKYLKMENPSIFIDIIQDGTLGLERAAEKFDWRKGFKFSTYATWWIRQSIGRSVSIDDSVFRVPSDKKDIIRKVTRAQQIIESNGVEASLESISALTGMSTDEVRKALIIRRQISLLSLDRPILGNVDSGEAESSLGDMLGQNDRNIELLENKFCVEAIMKVLSKIDEKNRDIISRRFGLEPYEPHSLEEIGRVYGVTRERIRQIEKKTLSLLSGMDEIVALK